MNEQKFTDLLGHIDPALIARAEKTVPMRQKPIFKRALIAAVAAMLALTMCASLIIIPFIPTTLGLDYLTSPSDGTEIAFKEQNAWIYYVENGKQKREYVRLPGDTQNVFMAWKHLSAVGDEVELLDYRFESDHAQATVVPDTLWEYLQQAFSPASGTVSVTLSPEITSYENYDTLIKSLTKTLAKFTGVDPEQVKIMIDGEQSILVGGLKFYHSLQDQLVFAGGQFDITVGMTNVSDYDIEFTGAWSDFVPKAKLRADSTIYVEQLLLPLPNDSTTEIAEYRLAPGESREVTYTFDIPYDAELGYYDLILSFGDAKMTFEGAVEVVVLTVPDIGTFTINMPEFEKFMQENYLEDTTVYEALRTFYGYTHQGQMIEYDEIIRDDLANGGTSEKAFHSLFAYDYSGPTNRAEGVCSYAYFTGKAIPDSLAPFDQDPKAFALPCGITEQDTLQQALCKMGMSEAVAMTLLDNPTSLTLAGSNTKNLSFMVSEEGDQYAIRYLTSVTIYAQDNLAETTTRSLLLEYDANGKFVQFTIEVRTELSASTVTGDEYLQFAEFLNSYGFTSASSTKFRWALENFKYQGSNVFTHMHQAKADWTPGLSGEYWMGHFSEYVTMTFNSGSTAHMQKSIFYATVLPDGVTLPANIYLDDSLFGALTKLGFSDQSVQSAILQSTDTILINTGSCYLGLRFENEYTSIDYCDTVQDGASTIVRQMQLRYNAATQKFISLYVCTSSSNFSFPVTITRTNHGQAVNWKLSDAQSLRLLEAVNTGNWELDWPIRTDFTLSPTFSFNGDSMLFEETWFLDQGCAVEVSRSLVKELLDSFTLYKGMVAIILVSDDEVYNVELDEQDAQALLKILNHGNWQENTEDDIFVEFHLTVGTKSLRYNATSGTFWNEHFQQALVLSEENRKTVNQILDRYMLELPLE